MATYTLWDELLASTTEPLPHEKRHFQLSRMWAGLEAMEGDNAEPNHWRYVSDAVNLLEVLIAMGEVADPAGLIGDVIQAMVECSARYEAGGLLKLQPGEAGGVRALLEDYAGAINALPARTVIRCHRLTEKRIQTLLRDTSRKPGTHIVTA